MKFLDEIGLAYFWEKIKASFVKTKGASEINMDDDNEGLKVNNVSSSSTTLVPSGFISYNINSDEQSEMVAKLQFGDLILKKIHIINGTSSQILIADGSTKTINATNGICGLDSNGNVPLSQLGNLDTTVAEVVTALPTTNIKKHIYLIKDTSGVTQNQYEEYIYTGDTSTTYDASKWEKLGDFRATVDLADYAKKSEAIHEVILGIHENTINLGINYVNGDQKELILPAVTVDHCGLMSPSDKTKLNLLDTLKVKTKVDVSQLLTASGAIPIDVEYNTNSLKVSFGTVAGGIISFTLPAAGDRAGLMSADDKTKLNGIAPNANNYSLPLAANGTRGGIQVGYAANGRNYPVQLSGEKAYVNVPWTDTNTTYDLSPYAKTADVNTALAKKVDVVSGKGLSTEDFTAALKTKLNGIATGATADSAIPTSVIDALN